MLGRSGRLATLVLISGVAVAVAGCSKSTPVPVKTVTVAAPQPTLAHPSPSHTPSGRSSASPSATRARPTTTPTPLHALRGPCDSLLTQTAVEAMIGSAGSGQTAFVVGVPDSKIGQVSYINCRYGVEGGGAPPAIEIGVSLYRTVKQAQRRIPLTVRDYTTNHSATVTDTMVDGKLAKLLTKGTGAGYDIPTIILSSGQRTIAVSITDSTEPSRGSTLYLTELAYLAVTRTGG